MIKTNDPEGAMVLFGCFSIVFGMIGIAILAGGSAVGVLFVFLAGVLAGLCVSCSTIVE